jgi:hypothetical protein
MYMINITTYTNLSMSSFPCQGYKRIALYYTCGSTQYDKYIAFYTADGVQLGTTITLGPNTWNIMNIPTGCAICGIYFRTYGTSVANTFYALYSW